MKISLGAAQERTDPAVWIHKLAVYSDWPLNDKTLLREITLRKGLNILWAEAGLKAPRGGRRSKVSGHATGKTTFCRLLRFILDDTNFGNDQFRESFQAKFRNGWTMGEVYVGGKLWMVGRPMGRVGYHPFAIQDRLITSLHGEQLPTGGYELYQAALEQAVFEGIGIRTLASSGRKFQWDCLLQWLTRDQECRFGELLDWRRKTSDSDPTGLSNPDKENLLRIILQLVTPEEQKLLRKHAEHAANHKLQLSLKPKLEYQATADRTRLWGVLKGTNLEVQDEKLQIESLKAGVQSAKETLQREEKELPAQDADGPYLATLETASREAGAATQSLQEVQQHLDYQTALLEAARGDKSAMQRAITLSKMLPFRGFCSHPLTLAWHTECPLADQRIEDEETDSRMRQVSDRAGALQVQIEQLTRDRDNRKAQVEVKKQAETIKRQELSKFQKEREGKRNAIEARKNRLQLIEQSLQNYEATTQSQAEVETELGSLEEKKGKIDAALQISAKQHQKIIGEFSTLFDYMSKHLLGEEVEAKVEFAGKSIEPVMVYHGKLDSAALSTVRLLAFDLTCLAFSVTGQGYHPRFLIHDSPREADMFVEIYYGLFQAARAIEMAAGDERRLNFQYIITTTEPPPDDLKKTPWLLDPVLNAVEAKGRLLGVDL